MDKQSIQKHTPPGKQNTAQNKKNRPAHSGNLRSRAQELSRFWQERRNERQTQDLPVIDGGVPFLLEIEPTTDVEFLRTLGFEIVCDLDEGFIVVSSEQTDLAQFLEKVDGFVDTRRGTGNIAKVYALHDEDNRLKRILSEELYGQWATLDDFGSYTVEISVSCSGMMPPPNMPNKRQSESDYEYSLRVESKKLEYYEAIDRIAMERQTQLENIVSAYDGEFLTSYIEDGDAFSVSLRISGNGLRDTVLNYAYIFEVTLKSEVFVDINDPNGCFVSEGLVIEAPEQGSPLICIIDTGIQENHAYLAPAILSDHSKCLIPDQTNTSDEVGSGGHGTRVAGAALYPNGIPTSGTYRLPCFIQNVKVLDADCKLSDLISREGIIESAVKDFAINSDVRTKIFNHSIGERKPFYELKHMSSWAAKIDEVSYEHDVLFVQAAGNMSRDVIRAHIQAGHSYPDYLGQSLSQISNPAQSLQALTVGSVSHGDFETDDTISMGKNGEPSSFTRVGPGIWDSIKPDVVEFGGTHAINKGDVIVDLTTPEAVCPELIRRSPEGPAFSKDGIGTSFSAPKVAYIASEVQKILPESPALLYRAFVAQSARWHNAGEQLSNEECQKMLRRVGYGIPNVERATRNNEYRATLATMELLEIGEKEAHVFTVNIPQEIRDLGEDYNILLEITLSYAAKPRRTRRSHRSYLSTWLDWICSKKNETQQDFEARIFEADPSGQHEGRFPWVIDEQTNWGKAKDFARNKQTLQKDWCVVNASEISSKFCIAVRGRKGWGSIFKAKYVLAVSFEAIDQNIEIYEHIRLSNQVEIEAKVKSPEINIEIDFTNTNP